MTNKEYDEMNGVRRSDLFLMKKSPLHFKYALDHKDEKEQTKALIFGSAYHKWVLEREDFNNEFAVAPNVDRRTKAGKEEYAAFLADSNGKLVISQDDLIQIVEMADALYANELASQLINGEHEVPMVWTDDATGETLKCKPDCITEYNGVKMCVDLKTTDSCQDGMFEHSCRKYGYYMQAAMYSAGCFECRTEDYKFVFVAQEKTAPYAVRVYFMSQDAIDEGTDEYRALLEKYHECKVKDEWPGYDWAELGGTNND